MVKIRTIHATNIKSIKKQKVAAYARVSSGKDAAKHSLSAQVSYYNNLISNHIEWELVDIYVDEGVSGTREDRPEFNRLMADARAGKIDLVITKSITRFARNTIVCLEAVRELRNLGIDVFFEKENIHSIGADGELMLTLLAMFAEEEARSASENQKWRIRKSYEQGIPTNGTVTYGYSGNGADLVIIPEEANIVREIYERYLGGEGLRKISTDLNNRKILNRNNGEWDTQAIRYILTNEKYVGDLLLGKGYIKDFRKRHVTKNEGERPMYLVKDSHEAIISREIFEAAQREHEKRLEEYSYGRKRGPKSMFASLIVCDNCGKHYLRKQYKNKNQNKTIYYWRCSIADVKGKKYCSNGVCIREDYLENIVKDALSLESLDNITLRDYLEEIRVTPWDIFVAARNGERSRYPYPDRQNKIWTDKMRQAASERGRKRFESGELKIGWKKPDN